MPQPRRFPLARQSAGHAPPRRPASIRRTTSIDSDWPDGLGQAWNMVGRARDLATSADGEATELGVADFRILVSPRREILSIGVTPELPGAQQLKGVRAGGASRLALADAVGDFRGGLAYQLLDDFAGASLVAPWIWTRWAGDAVLARVGPPPNMTNICTGFAEGATSMDADGRPRMGIQSSAKIEPLEDPADPEGWHAMPQQSGPEARRARRIDLWREGRLIKVDAGFQDSGPTPDGGRTAVHEYRVFADIDAESGALTALQALPLVLPFAECPGAAVEADRLIGQQVASFRETVPQVLASVLGCTHLNDVLRGLADVAALARRLPSGPAS